MRTIPFPRLLATVSLLGLTAAATLGITPVRSEETAVVADHKLQGSFIFSSAGSDSIDKAIEKAVADMSFFIAPIARSRLTKTNTIYRKIAFEFTGSQVSIVSGSRAAIKSSLNGSSMKWTREDGEVLDYSTTQNGDTLRQKFVAGDGQRVNEYIPSSDGQGMTLKVTVTSPKLKEPLVYRQAYKKGN